MSNISEDGADEGSKLNLGVVQEIRPEQKSDADHELDALIGAWTEEDKTEFTAVVAPFEAIDPGLRD